MWGLRVIQRHDDRLFVEGADDLDLKALRCGHLNVVNEVIVVCLWVGWHHHNQHLDRVGVGEPLCEYFLVAPEERGGVVDGDIDRLSIRPVVNDFAWELGPQSFGEQPANLLEGVFGRTGDGRLLSGYGVKISSMARSSRVTSRARPGF